MVLLTLIARVRDGLILATSIEGADDAHQNMVKYNSQAKLLFRKLSTSGSPTMQTVASGAYFFQFVYCQMFFLLKIPNLFLKVAKIFYLIVFDYLIKDNICALCLCDQNFPRKLAFSYLDDIATEFLSQNSSKIESTIRPFHFLEFDMYIQQTKPKYTDKSRFAMTAVKNDLRDVTRIMVSNIEDVLHRGEALNILESRASDLSDLSRKYREDARRLNQKSAVFKLFVGISIASVLFLFVRFLLF